MTNLKNKKILLCVTGSIAAYKACEFIRLLKKQDCFIQVVMTNSAKDFIGRLSLASLSGNPVMVDSEQTGLDHVNFAIEFDLIVILPSTANIICKAANGIADDMVSTILSICEQPKLFVPAMNFRMWQSKATQDAVASLQKNGVTVMTPNEGYLASMDKGEGRLPDLHHTLNEIRRIFDIPTPLKDKKILITAGPTREHLDPIRFLSNKSSGKMGYAFAETIRDMGGDVTLISGPVAIDPPSEISTIYIETTDDMYDEMNKYLDVDMIIMCAAIADYTPTHKSDIKIKRDNENLSVNMKPTIDIVQAIAKKTKALIVAFALETSDGEKNAKNKLTNKGVDYIILNHPDEDNCGIDSNYNKVIIFDKNNNKKEFHKDRKDRIANNVMKFIINQEKQKNKI
jgi:phosphopantothenoylcysteine decarboxylase/phosphopantothenate--cysteine ligase